MTSCGKRSVRRQACEWDSHLMTGQRDMACEWDSHLMTGQRDMAFGLSVTAEESLELVMCTLLCRIGVVLCVGVVCRLE